MKNLLNIGMLLMVFTFLSATTSVNAQKYGYTNSQALLVQMPEVKQMNAKLETMQKQLEKQGQGMVAKFQAKYQKALKDAQDGKLTPVQQKQIEGELAKQQEDIVKFEQKMVTDLQKKQQDLLAPILKKLETAIKNVSKEKGYTFIFDSSVLLYGAESQDVTKLVKAKLGI